MLISFIAESYLVYLSQELNALDVSLVDYYRFNPDIGAGFGGVADILTSNKLSDSDHNQPSLNNWTIISFNIDSLAKSNDVWMGDQRIIWDKLTSDNAIDIRSYNLCELSLPIVLFTNDPEYLHRMAEWYVTDLIEHTNLVTEVVFEGKTIKLPLNIMNEDMKMSSEILKDFDNPVYSIELDVKITGLVISPKMQLYKYFKGILLNLYEGSPLKESILFKSIYIPQEEQNE